MKTVITVQHTQSPNHLNGMVGSWTDWDLTDEGIRQAGRIAGRLASVVEDKDWRMYTSDQRRARHTARIIADALGMRLIQTQMLREQNLGPAVGQSERWLREHGRPERTVADRCLDGAESVQDVWNRIAPFVRDIMAGKADNVIVVSHGMTLSVLNAIWLGMAVEDLNRCALRGSAGGVSFLYLHDDGKRVIRRLSDMSFAAE